MVQRLAFALPSLLWRDDYGWHNATALACLRLRHHKRHIKNLAKTFIACFLLTVALPTSAQNEIFTVTNSRFASTHSGEVVVPVTLGQSVVALYGPWKFHIGDNPQWADANFDDSQWETVDLRPTPQTKVSCIPFEGFVTGWQERGHPGYAGFAWYRLRVHISGDSGPLTLLGPEWFEGGYQLFVNGRLVGSFGDFAVLPPELYYPNPASFTVPGPVRSTQQDHQGRCR